MKRWKRSPSEVTAVVGCRRRRRSNGRHNMDQYTQGRYIALPLRAHRTVCTFFHQTSPPPLHAPATLQNKSPTTSTLTTAALITGYAPPDYMWHLIRRRHADYLRWFWQESFLWHFWFWNEFIYFSFKLALHSTYALLWC